MRSHLSRRDERARRELVQTVLETSFPGARVETFSIRGEDSPEAPIEMDVTFGWWAVDPAQEAGAGCRSG